MRADESHDRATRSGGGDGDADPLGAAAPPHVRRISRPVRAEGRRGTDRRGGAKTDGGTTRSRKTILISLPPARRLRGEARHWYRTWVADAGADQPVSRADARSSLRAQGSL